ncbi:MAG: type II toxin-antitoxin system RelE/ParE family toxin [Elusimicrobiales bacterium]|nr:type II toxin-antitoxin system RelE/ParE family toxin [Elusimicrobiales bacterium]
MEYFIELYQTPGGDYPVDDFLMGLPDKVRAKVATWIKLLKQEGPNLKRPHADMLRDGIRELRISFGRLEIRILYFIHGKQIVLTNGFLKKTQQTPANEIDRAERYRADWLR